MVRSLFITGLLAILLRPASGQSRPSFEIADVHVSPRSAWVKKSANNMQGGYLNAGRYEIKRATMLDLIKMAYAVDADKISGGPSWLDYDRFEVVAKAPPTASPATLRLMLQSLLADRFGLVVATDAKPMPAYVLSAGKDRSKLKPAEAGGTPGCSQDLVFNNDTPSQVIRCKSVTMETFAADLRRFFGARIGNLPLVDRTNIEGTWDIELQYALIATRIGGDAPAGPAPNPSAVTIEAINKQLGLVLSLGTAPQPVLAVQRVNKQPSANPAGVAAALPPLPPPVFEVASLKLCNGGPASINTRFEVGGRVTATCMPPMVLISDAWGLAPSERPLGMPKWLQDGGTTAYNVSLVAKAPQGNFSGGQGVTDRDALNAMMRNLLLERYQMKVHYEDRQVDALTLTAGKPKLTKADPTNRTACTRQPGDNLSIRLVCQNMTLTQFAEQMQSFDSQIFYPVLDATSIDGAWDITLNYRLNLSFPVRSAAPAGQAPDPEVLPTFTEAVERTLGLKLEARKRMSPVLVIDQMADQLLEN